MPKYSECYDPLTVENIPNVLGQTSAAFKLNTTHNSSFTEEGMN